MINIPLFRRPIRWEDLWVLPYENLSPVTRHPSPVTRHPSPVTRHPSPVTRHPSPVTRHPSPVTRHPSPVTRHPSPVTRHLSQFLVLLLLLLTSCDIIQAPFIETADNGSTTTTNPKKVLLFDFTGHTCKSCPKAHKTIDQLVVLYGDRIVPIAFHLGYFAKPLTSGKFTTDFRTPEGTLLEKHFDFVSFPTGTVQTLNCLQLQPYASWSTTAVANITGDAPVKIGITTEYLAGLNAVRAQVTLRALEPITGQLNLAVYLAEDSITDWQKDEDFDPMDIPDYLHNHVFRTSLNGLWGQAVGNADGMVKDYTFEAAFSKILNPGWKSKNCVMIAFVYREDTKEVVQVEAKEF